MLRRLFTTAAASMAAVVCNPSASAQEISCDLAKRCETDHVLYDPEDKQGFALFSNVLVYLDGHRLRKIVDTPLPEMDSIHVEIGDCEMDVVQPHTPFPTPEGNPEFRRNMARNAIQALRAGMKELPSALSVSEPKLMQDLPGLVQYQIVSQWTDAAGLWPITEVRRVTVGYYQSIQKSCEGPDEEATLAIYDAHRVSLRNGP
jgi:hypothetical protein